jgi:(1->4)-alpha-D-glucan 1-alpha-D-glucosylmutase
MSRPRPFRYPSSTYRLQLGPTLTLAEATRAVPYLHRLGVSALYLSPLLKARPGSTHGYDICDHTSINPDLGTEEDLGELAAEARRHGMHLIADIVPNHVGVDPVANIWWREVLENGPCSSYAEYFDIDWDPVTPNLQQKILMPILGDQYGTVLERGELQLAFEDGRLWLHYYEKHFPVNPRQTPLVLTRAVPLVEAQVGRDAPEVIELLSVLTGLSNLPPYTDRSPESIETREREKEVLRLRLLRLVTEAPLVAQAIDQAVREANGRPGDPGSFDDLHALLEAQPYRLASWRTAVDEINYRRFFDINDLAGVRVENEVVFEATHALIGQWLAAGWLEGLRVDHPDGLFDPAGYFKRLQELSQAVTGQQAPLYVVAEKILSPGEPLRSDWQVEGTTGYSFLNDINGLFVEPAGLRALRRLHTRMTGERDSLEEIVYESKKLIIGTAMSSELGVLVDALGRIARAHRHTRDFTLNSLRDLITEYVACFPVYRTYVTRDGWTQADEDIVDQTLARARRRNPAMESSLFRFLRAVLLPAPVAEGPASGPEHPPQTTADRDLRFGFSMKLQQYTGPVQAKALEDTAFYRYNVLVSTNEVGGEPAHALRSIEALHAANVERQRSWPLEMTTLSTHDTKLGEDVRARINALSELPSSYREVLGRLTRTTGSARTMVDGAWAPDRNDEYRFYQVLLGTWPHEHDMARPLPRTYVDRLKAYMLKAIREAKRHTSWLTPNERYEDATLHYVEQVLLGRQASRALPILLPLAARLARHGVVNSLAQTALRLAAPGVPDTYQGTERWAFVLVDPDNRQPVDFEALTEALEAVDHDLPWPIEPAAGRALLDGWADGYVKLLVTSRLLRERRDAPDLWVDGEYLPIPIDLEVEGTAIAWARRHGDAWAVTAAVVRAARLAPHDWPLGSLWATSRLLLPADLPGTRLRDVFTGAVHPIIQTDGERWIFLAQAFAALPVSVLVPEA